MADIKYEIEQKLGVIGESKNGWTKEINLISWNGYAAKYDIRDWDPEHFKMAKGITLTREEAETLRDILNEVL